MTTKKSKKESVELPDDPISWREITKYSRGNPWIRIPTDEMFTEGGLLIPFRYGDKKLIVRYDKDYVCNWFEHFLQPIAYLNIKIVIDHLIDYSGLDYQDISDNSFSDTTSNIPVVSDGYTVPLSSGPGPAPLGYFHPDDDIGEEDPELNEAQIDDDEDDDNNRDDRDDNDTTRSLCKSIIVSNIVSNSNCLNTEGNGLDQLNEDDDFSDLSSDDDELLDTPLVAEDDQDIDHSKLKAQGEYNDSY